MHKRNQKLKDGHGESSGVTKLLMPRDDNVHPKKLDELTPEEQDGQWVKITIPTETIEKLRKRNQLHF